MVAHSSILYIYVWAIFDPIVAKVKHPKQIINLQYETRGLGCVHMHEKNLDTHHRSNVKEVEG